MQVSAPRRCGVGISTHLVVKDVAQACGISAMPTFQFYKSGSKVDELRGADVQGLTTKIGYYTSAAIKANSTQGTKLGESRTFQGSSPISTGSGSLKSLLNIEACSLLNVAGRSSIRSIVKPTFAAAAIESSSGPQIIIHLVFTEAVNPTSVRLSVPEDARAHAPSKLHLGSNLGTPKDMNALIKAESVQSFVLFSDEYVKGSAELKLKAAKFTKTKSLTILIETNINEDQTTTTKLGQIDIIGSKVPKS